MNIGGFLKPLVTKTGGFITKHSPEILMTMGTGSVVTAVIFAVRATPKAEQLLYEAHVAKVMEEENLPAIESAERVDRERTDIRLTFAEKVKATWKAYIPTAGMVLFGIGCFWTAHGIDLKRQAVLAGLYSTAETALQEYQRKVVEMIGDKNEKEIRKAVQDDRIEKNPPPTLIIPGQDDWCVIDGQYFPSNWNKIERAEIDANREMINHMYISQADLYWMLDPDHKYLKTNGYEGQVGWNVDEYLVLWKSYTNGPDGRPILIIEYEDRNGRPYPPRPGFSASL